MLIKSVTIGGWFQRTTLHLSEIQFFLNGKDILGLDAKVLQKNLKSLGVKHFERVVDEIEYLVLDLQNGLRVKITEDGLVTLKANLQTEDFVLLKTEIEKVKSFYENNLSKAIGYIFSRGAPVPKELAKIENIYPYILDVQTNNIADVLEIYNKLKDEISSNAKAEKVTIYKGKKLMVIQNINDLKVFDLFAETEIFFREFKTQMSRYLHIHREIWEKINVIKNRDSIKGHEILQIREELQEEQKTINLIEARINQMPTYLKTRAKLTDISSLHKDLHPLFQYKFETLLDTHDYIKSLWAMTKNYLNSANDMLGVLQTESTKSSISSLTLITTIGVVAGIVNYMVRDTYPKVTATGFVYFLILLLLTFLVNLGVVYFYKYKKYKIKK
jgi:hypothetical protein